VDNTESKAGDRIYIVTGPASDDDGGGEVLIRAKSQAQAIQQVVCKLYTARVAKAVDVANLLAPEMAGNA